MSDLRGRLRWWGVDGCQGGWLCVGLGEGTEVRVLWKCSIEAAYEAITQDGGETVLIDIPIGLPNAEGRELKEGESLRKCDGEARRFVGERHSSVFPVPCREAVHAFKGVIGTVAAFDELRSSDSAGYREKRASAWKAARESSKKASSRKKSLSNATLAIVPKIIEIDDLLRSCPEACGVLREMHPEVCFCALNGGALKFSKKDVLGICERRQILEEHCVCWCNMLETLRCARAERGTPFPSMIPADDLLDAAVGALTAKLARGERLRTLPKRAAPKSPEQKDERQLPMEMVYYSP